MRPRENSGLTRATGYAYTVFIIASTFSIALAQMAFATALALYLVDLAIHRTHPFVRQLRWFYGAIIAYLVWQLISNLAGNTPLASIDISKEEWLFMIIPVGIHVMKDEKVRSRLITAFTVSFAIATLYAIIEYSTGIDWLHMNGYWFAPAPSIELDGNFDNALTFGNYWVTGAMLLLAIGLGEGREGKKFSIPKVAVAAVAMVVTFLSGKRGPMAAGAIGLMLMTIWQRRKARYVTLGLLASLAVVVVMSGSLRSRFTTQLTHDTSDEFQGSRTNIWRHSWEVFTDHPILGVGNGNFAPAYATKLPAGTSDNYKFTHAHNDLLNEAAVGGLPLALCFAAFWCAALVYLARGALDRRIPDYERALCFAALLASIVFFATSITEATFVDEEPREFLMFIWALGLGVVYKYGTSPKPAVKA